jgi:tRNA nucleotidyltransferase (CCA-adding enzyme)
MDIITTHLNADFDALGAMLGAKKLYPGAAMVFSGSQEGNLRHFLENSDYPFGFLKIRHIDFDKVSRLIIVDIKTSSRIGVFADLLDQSDISVHIYDHHPETSKTIHGDFECIRKVGATTTILTKLIREKGISLSSEEATIMLMGIYEDTSFLSSPSTRPNDLYAAAWLLECGADLTAISEHVNRGLSTSQFHLLNNLLDAAEKIIINDIVVVISAVSVKEYIADIAVLAHRMLELEDIDVLFVLVEMENRTYFIARSIIESVDVGQVAKEFGGGGHIYAASATIHSKTLIQAREELIKILREKIKPVKRAVDIMNRPVRWISEECNIQEARDFLLRYHLNTLVVLDRHEEFAGIITRQIVDRALTHKMEDSPVSDCMHADVRVATPHTPLRETGKLMIEGHQGFLPVVEGKKVVGVISRGDLLHVIHDDMAHHRKTADDHRVKLRTHHKNLKNLLHERLPASHEKIIQLVGEIADELNLSIYLVGGVVRDLLLRAENLDMDVVVEEDGITFAKCLARRVNGRLRAHEKFCTAVVVFPDGFKLDIATARTEFYKHPAALPIVDISSIKQDLYRRDFTINAMAVRINKKGFGELIDFFNGQQDLKDRLIRVLHSLSFVEDPARVFRAIRFEKRLGFRIGSHTLNLMRNTVRQGFCDQLDSMRLLYELNMIFQETDPIPIFDRMADMDLLKSVQPELNNNKNFLKRMKSIKTVLDWYHFLFLPQKPDIKLIYLMGFMQDIIPAEVDNLTKRFFLSPRREEIITTTQTEYKRVLCFLDKTGDISNILLFDTLTHLPLETLLFYMATAETERAPERISRYLTTLAKIKIKITGDDLIKMGLSPGPIFREIFREVNHKQMEGHLSSRKAQLEYVRRHHTNELKIFHGERKLFPPNCHHTSSRSIFALLALRSQESAL